MKKEIYGYIYKIRNILDNKIYIGQTAYNFDKRYAHHLDRNTSNIHLKRAIKKYGLENFEVDEEFDVAYSKEELDKLEDMYIKLYNLINMKYGYNMRFGGARGKHTEEVKQKMRENHVAITGENHHRYKKGYLVAGDKNPRAKKVICLTTGKVFNTADEAAKEYGIGTKRAGTQVIACCSKRKKIKTCGKDKDGNKLVWMYYDKYLESTKEQIDEIIIEANTCRKGENKAKKVICLTTGKVFNSAMEAARFYNGNNSTISSCCRGITGYSGKLQDGTKLTWSFC